MAKRISEVISVGSSFICLCHCYPVFHVHLHVCLSQIKQKSLDKAKEEEKASKEFAAMEAAALKAYQEDLKRLGLESGKTTARHFKTNIPGHAEGPFHWFHIRVTYLK